MPRLRLICVSSAICLLVASASLADVSPVAATTQAASSKPQLPRDENPPGVIDRLEQVIDADSWSAGTLVNANVHPDAPARVELGYREADYPRQGSWTSPENTAAFPFSELIASFNVSTPGKTGVTLDVRVEQEGVWSPWVFMQNWGRTLTPPGRPTAWEGGRADVDTLKLDKPAAKYQMRIGFCGFEFDPKAAPPSIRRLSVCYTGIVSDPDRRAELLHTSNPPPANATRPPDTRPPDTRPTAEWARDLDVPFRAQGADSIPKALRELICSPTSTSMVLQFYGADHSTLDNAAAIYDSNYDLFGNWGRAISRAGELGLDAYLTRFRDWDAVHAMIARGTPVIASIRFRRGEAKGFLYEFTEGHLLVIRGFKPNGDVIVNDPARKQRGNGVVYKPDELAKAWFGHGGVAYVIERPREATPATPPAVSDR